MISISPLLFQIPQRYRFSSKSQQLCQNMPNLFSCFRYHKGTDFQANHNKTLAESFATNVVLDTTKVQIFKQITTPFNRFCFNQCCFRYHKGTDFQANHNTLLLLTLMVFVVLDTTKVQIFKQITTEPIQDFKKRKLFQIPQRYRFSSKSQHVLCTYFPQVSCFRYHKGTDFQANHNAFVFQLLNTDVVLDTTKVQIFKQITTLIRKNRYLLSCFRYHKGTDFQANHNRSWLFSRPSEVVLDTTKVQIFKQITTVPTAELDALGLFQIPQRYRFSSKSQRYWTTPRFDLRCFRYHKGTDFQANHNTSQQ